MSNTYLNKDLQIESKYASLITLIDSIYPACKSTKKKYICIHPHCDQRYSTKGALRFHISKSHLVNHTKKPLLDPIEIPQVQTSPSLLPPPVSSPSPPPPPPPPLSPPQSLLPPPIVLAPHIILLDTPSPPTSPFSSYKSPSSKKPMLSLKTEKFLNSVYSPLECPCCHQLFNKKTNVIKHLSDTHTGQEPYRCIYTDCHHTKLYATREGLVYHIARFHDK